MTAPESPAEQRSAARAARRSLDAAERAAAEASIATLVTSLDELGEPGRIGWYHAADGEVDLSLAATPLRRRGWRVFLPVIGATSSMSFAEWVPDGQLVANRFGIMEPAPDSRPAVPATALDVVVVPCVAVDPSGHRLGFGAGYYDRALAEPSAVIRVGVAFEAQVVDRIDPAPWDVPLDVIVTERRVIRPGR